MRCFCIKQKKQTDSVLGSDHYVKTKNNRLMLKSTCAECVVTKTKFVKSQKGGENPLGKAFKAAELAEKAVRKLIPSTDHVFDRYWSGEMVKNAFTGPTGITRKKFWTHPKKGTVMRLVKNPKTGKYENVYVEP